MYVQKPPDVPKAEGRVTQNMRNQQSLLSLVGRLPMLIEIHIRGHPRVDADLPQASSNIRLSFPPRQVFIKQTIDLRSTHRIFTHRVWLLYISLPLASQSSLKSCLLLSGTPRASFDQLAWHPIQVHREQDVCRDYRNPQYSRVRDACPGTIGTTSN